MLPSDGKTARLTAAQRVVALQAECDQPAALRLMIDRGLVQRLSLDQIADGVLDGTARFAA